MSPEEPKRTRGLLKAFGLLVGARAAMRAARRRPPAPPQESDLDPSERQVPSNRRAETHAAEL